MVKSKLIENEIEEGDIVMWWSEIINDVIVGKINHFQKGCTLSGCKVEVEVFGEDNRMILGEVNVVKIHRIFTMDYIENKYSKLESKLKGENDG